MSSLTEYIKWYADFSFYEKPFNHVDNMVLSMLAYYSFDLKKTGGRPAQLKRCVSNSLSGDAFLSAACASHRFGHIIVSDVVEIFDKKASAQFAAMNFKLCDGLYYIAFRGTDNSLVGWREDFMISYTKTVAQTEAADYLEKVIGEGEYYIGGHSKGGNLAIYGACHLSDEKLRSVKRIYNNDGPGLCPEVSDIKLIKRIRTKTTVIYPQFCVFGKIFDNKFPDIKIVKSSDKGIMQHDIITWQVDCGELDMADDFDPDCLPIIRVTEKWLKDVTPEERERLVKSLFDTFEAGGAETRQQILSGGIDDVEDLVKNMVESDTVKTAAKIPEKLIFGDFFARLREGKLSKFINANQLIEGVAFVIAGILMLFLQKDALQFIVVILLGGITIFQLCYTVKKLYENHWNFSRERTRVYIFLVVATLFVLTLVKDQASFIVGSGIAGGWLLVVAYKSFIAFKESGANDFAYYKNIFKAILYMICGVFILLTPRETLKWIILSLGVIMAIDGICTIVYSFIQANEKYAEKYKHLKDKVSHKKKD